MRSHRSGHERIRAIHPAPGSDHAADGGGCSLPESSDIPCCRCRPCRRWISPPSMWERACPAPAPTSWPRRWRRRWSASSATSPACTEMTSSSQLGSTNITLQFDLSRNIDGAARDVEAAINSARSYLPANLPSNPTYRKVNPADSPIMIVGLTSNVFSQGQMYDYASTIMAQRISQIQGVGQVAVGGSSSPAVRVEVESHAAEQLRPVALRHRIPAAAAEHRRGAGTDHQRCGDGRHH